MDLLTVLPRTSEHPRYRILHCTVCSFIEWVAERIIE